MIATYILVTQLIAGTNTSAIVQDSGFYYDEYEMCTAEASTREMELNKELIRNGATAKVKVTCEKQDWLTDTNIPYVIE